MKPKEEKSLPYGMAINGSLVSFEDFKEGIDTAFWDLHESDQKIILIKRIELQNLFQTPFSELAKEEPSLINYLLEAESRKLNSLKKGNKKLSRKARPIALIDLDSTLADYKGAMDQGLALLKADGEPLISPSFDEIVPDYIRNRIIAIRRTPGWWENLPPIESGFEIIKLLKKHGFSINILSKAPESSPNAWTEKFNWCQKHVKGATVSLSPKKELFYGRILFDDYHGYVEPWLNNRPRGIAIVPLKEWNKNFKHPRAIHWTGNNLHEVEDMILKALPDEEEES